MLGPESRQIGSGQTGDGKSERQHFRNQRTKMDWTGRKRAKPSPRKRNAKKQHSCLRRPYKIPVKRREAKSKGEKERYTHLNAEFQRIARRDKKAFHSDQ